MARYLVNERFFNDRLYYEGEVYDLQPSEIARITASRQMHHLRLIQADSPQVPVAPLDPLDELAKRLEDLSPEDRDRLADKLRPEKEKTEKQEDVTPTTAPAPAPAKPPTRAELAEMAEKKGIKIDANMTKAQIAEKLAQAAPGA